MKHEARVVDILLTCTVHLYTELTKISWFTIYQNTVLANHKTLVKLCKRRVCSWDFAVSGKMCTNS